jgi:hypothetical protein
MNIGGAEVTAQRGTHPVHDEEKLRAELERWFAEGLADELPSFACIEGGEYSLVILGPRDTGRLSWSISILAPTYRRIRAALKSLGLESRTMRERDFTAFIHP